MLAFFGVPQDDKISVLILKLKTPPYKPRFPHVYTMFREGGTHPQEHRREDAMVVVSGDVGRYARNLMRAMLRCALRAVTLVAQKGGDVLRAPCSVSGTGVSRAVQIGAIFWALASRGEGVRFRYVTVFARLRSPARDP